MDEKLSPEQNQAIDSKPSPQNIATPPIQQKPQAGDELVFFNVMPKANSQSAYIEPKIKTVIAEKAVAPNKYVEYLSKYKRYVIIGLGVLILGIVIYLIVIKLGSIGYEEQSLLVKQPTGQSPKTQSPNTQTNGQQGFTTPQAWRDKYFPGCTDDKSCGDSADPDHDGLTNAQEYKLGTDPNNPDSDQDGLSDGDEVNVFGSDPLNSHTAKDPKFSDSDFLKGGFDIATNKKMAPDQITALSEKMKQTGLHQPTITTLGTALNTLYNFTPENTASPVTASSTPVTSSSTTQSTIDQSVDAKQSRDTQRSDTIKNIEMALVKYNTDNKTYPQTNDFNILYSDVKLYLKVATNPIDPINNPPYTYSYSSNADGSDFAISFYSEVAGQLITKTSANAIKDAGDEQASIYDYQRETDLESIRTALLLYSQNNVSDSQDYVFPTKAKYKTSIVPQYISVIPVDPKTGAAYDYEVAPTFNTFTLKTSLDNPPTGATGYVCNQDSCQNY